MGTKPSLPDRPTPWSDRTKAWWDSLDQQPGASEWTDADWLFALDTALLVQQVWEGELGNLKELRMRETALGITPSARQKSMVSVTTTECVTETPLQRILERRVERRGLESQPTPNLPAASTRKRTR